MPVEGRWSYVAARYTDSEGALRHWYLVDNFGFVSPRPLCRTDVAPWIRRMALVAAPTTCIECMVATWR